MSAVTSIPPPANLREEVAEALGEQVPEVCEGCPMCMPEVDVQRFERLEIGFIRDDDFVPYYDDDGY